MTAITRRTDFGPPRDESGPARDAVRHPPPRRAARRPLPVVAPRARVISPPSARAAERRRALPSRAPTGPETSVPRPARPARPLPASLAVLLLAAVALPAAAQPPAPTRPAAGRGQLAVTPAAPGSAADTALVQGLRWRNIGPFRGGRA